jgi:aminopeptidase N
MNLHQLSGDGYTFLAQQVLSLDKLNPQIAARLLTPLTHWRRYDKTRQSLMKTELERIQASSNLSKDVYEIVAKSI